MNNSIKTPATTALWHTLIGVIVSGGITGVAAAYQGFTTNGFNPTVLLSIFGVALGGALLHGFTTTGLKNADVGASGQQAVVADIAAMLGQHSGILARLEQTVGHLFNHVSSQAIAQGQLPPPEWTAGLLSLLNQGIAAVQQQQQSQAPPPTTVPVRTSTPPPVATMGATQNTAASPWPDQLAQTTPPSVPQQPFPQPPQQGLAWNTAGMPVVPSGVPGGQ